ncbi:MAG: RNA 2'-phosphotransferase [Phototrophicaceae bacterium]
MKKDLKRLSKFMAVVLRHNPEKFNVVLDEQGFTSVDSLWRTVEAKFGETFSRDDLQEIVTHGDKNGKKRYEIVGKEIRAMYGHSQPEIVYPVVMPPPTLFHGTNNKALAKIRSQGLIAGKRQFVHMTTNYDMARIVAKRRTQAPIILAIRADEAYQVGIVFHQPDEEHYLAKSIPATYINFPND